MRYKIIYIFIFILTSIMLLILPITGDGNAFVIQDNRQLVIASADNGPLSIERLLFVALNNIEFTVDFIYPVVREGYIQANEGTIDGVVAGYPDLHQLYTNLIQVPVPLEKIHVRVFAREGSSFRINKWDELSGLKIGILEHRTYILQRLPENADITTKHTNRAVLNGLVNGEYDVAVLTEREHEVLGERLNVTRVGVLDILTDYLYLNQKHTDIVPEIADSLRLMFADGRANKILNFQPSTELSSRKTIIHIISSSVEIEREDQFNAALRSQFEDDLTIEWMTINIDSQRFFRGQRNLNYIAALLRADSVSRNVAAIIVSGEPALEFLQDYYAMFFRNVPVLFYGVSNHFREIIYDSEYNYTGIVKNIEAFETVNAALTIFPDTENIFVINGHTDKDFMYRRAIEADLKPLEPYLNITFNDDVGIDELLRQINTLPDNSLIFVGSYFVDAYNNYFSLGEMKRLLERNSNVPILSVFSTNLEYNALGGKSPDYRIYGFEIAAMLKQILNGSTAEEIPVIYNSTAFNRWVFNQHYLDKFNVNIKDLPEGSEIINATPSIRETNPQFFIAMIIVVIISVLLIIGTSIFLFISHKYNKQKNKLQKELAIEKDAAQAASKAKSNFLTNMSHEMRTPLTAVLGLTELMLKTAYLSDETYSNLVKVYRAGETLLYLVNDILDISKIEANKLEINQIKYDVPSLLNDSITQSINYIKDKPVELIVNINDDLPNYIYGDELRVKQIINNLLSNAFKFTKEGTVEFSFECERDNDIFWLTIKVRDTGIGIKSEDIDKLFTLYFRMDEEYETTDRRTEGTGLGLYITKRIAETLNGYMTVESEYGVGSTFTAVIPQGYVNDITIDKNIINNLKSSGLFYNEVINDKTSRLNMSYARVLVVDDNPVNLDVIKGLLGLYRIRADCVNGGAQAVEAIRREEVNYNAIFMDHMMSEIDGIEATRIIREEIDSDYAKKVPIIALTANAIVGNEEMFLSKGFQAFVSKPIDLTRLDTVLRKWVRDKEKEASLPDQMINIDEEKPKIERKILLNDIPGLDIDRGISHFGNIEEAYISVLHSYVNYTRDLLKSLEPVGSGNINDYAVTIHGIKGSSFGIFADAVGNEAESLEKAALNGNFNFITANNKVFIDNLNKLLDDIEKAIRTSMAFKEKPVKDKIDNDLLNNLLKACKNFDIDEIDNLMSEIDGYYYDTDADLAQWLQLNINKGKYKSVADKISQLNEKHERKQK